MQDHQISVALLDLILPPGVARIDWLRISIHLKHLHRKAENGHLAVMGRVSEAFKLYIPFGQSHDLSAYDQAHEFLCILELHVFGHRLV